MRSVMDESKPEPDQLFGIPKIPNKNTNIVAMMTITFQRKFLFMTE
jgi:hypothetical protein